MTLHNQLVQEIKFPLLILIKLPQFPKKRQKKSLKFQIMELNELSKDSQSESVTFALSFEQNSLTSEPPTPASALQKRTRGTRGRKSVVRKGNQATIKEETSRAALALNDETLDGFSIEENTLMSNDNENLNEIEANGEESQQSQTQSSSSKSTKKKRRTSILTDVDQSLGAKLAVSQLHVYKWPQDEPGAELYVLQEQLSDFLEIKSFKRKYPEVFRRCIDIKEREYLRENNIVSETQCDLGLTALKLSEMMDIMCVEYPEKYKVKELYNCIKMEFSFFFFGFS